MLGLASAVSTASIHEQRYSLSLDGAGDYLIVRNGFNRASRTFSAWFNSAQNTVTQSYGNVILSQTTSGGDNRWHARIDPATNLVKIYNGASVTVDSDAGTTISLNSWYHLIVTEDGSTVNYYINGELEGSDNVAIGTGDSDLFTVGQEFDGSSSSDHFKGLIGDVAAWGVVLDEAAALDVYNAGSPFDLNTDRGTYDNASDLIGYWKMGYGSFDDKAHGVVHDQTNPGFGAELIVNADFSDYEAENQERLIGGIQFNDWGESPGSGTAIFTSIPNGFRRTALSPSTSVWHQRINQNLHATLVIGGIYKFSVNYLTSDGTTIRLAIQTPGSQSLQSGGSLTTTANVMHTFTGYFVCDTVTDIDIDIFPNTNMEVDAFFEISNITLRKLNSNPGLTAADATFTAYIR
tara:strand:- start:291 stop:1508 length:1218 start_codon:yes stop_codon:yes gene_type:complete